MHFICGLLYLCGNTQMESSRIADQIRRSIHGEAWHGPSVLEILNDADWRQAAAKPIAGAHSIWEIILHIAAWADVALRRACGETLDLTPAQDWPQVTHASEQSWRTGAHTRIKAGFPCRPHRHSHR